jgi:hypothetical protein
MNCKICQELPIQNHHHIISKNKGGTDDIWNIADICASCHYNVHKGFVIVEGNFLTSTGYQLIWHMKGEPSITGFEPEVHIW